MLEIRNLTAGYPGNVILKDLSTSIPAGSLTVIIGPNGSGKSTFVKALAGILPCSGDILFRGTSLPSLSRIQRAQTLAYLPQHRSISEIPVRQLVLHGRFPWLSWPRHYRPEDQTAAENAMAQLGILSLAHRPLSTLSGGERQKANLAMLLAQQTPVVLMDEPTAALDIAHKFEVLDIARKLTQTGKTVIVVLHELDLALDWADHILLLDQGKLRMAASPDAVFDSGLLQQVFHIRAQRLESDSGIHYLFSPPSGP